MTDFDHREPLFRGEAEFTISLVAENASPFMAHHQPSDPEAVRRAVLEEVDGHWDGVVALFRLFPRVAIWTIASALAEHYGEEGDNACYPHIQRALGLPEALSPAQKDQLRRRFRSAALRLGLALPVLDEVILESGHRPLRAQPADDFFLQAGVPLNQVDRLGEIFRKGEGAVGPPPIESTAALSRWERDSVTEFCPPGIARLPKVLLFDGSGFHAGVFAALASGDRATSPLAVRLQEVRERLPAATARGAPRLLCLEGRLVIRDSYGRAGFRASLSEEEVRVAPGGMLTLPLPWPAEVACTLDEDQGRHFKVQILPPGFHFLVFDAGSGRLEAAVGGEARELLKVNVPRGEVAIAARTGFEVGGVEAVDAGDGCHLLYVDLRSEQRFRSEEVEAQIVPRPRPELRILGGPAIGRWGAAALIPGVTGVELDYPDPGGSREFEVHLSHPALPDGAVVLPVTTPDSGEPVEVDLRGVLPSTGPFGRLRCSFREPGARRDLRVESIWWWPGLESLDAGQDFVAAGVPDNWDADRSEHVRRHDGRLSLQDPGSNPYLAARLVFGEMDAPEEGTAPPLAQFTLPPPGVSLLLRDANGQSRPLRMGQVLALSPGDGAYLEIRTPQPGARLDVKGSPHEFDRFGWWRLTSAGIAHAGPPQGGHAEIRYLSPERGAAPRPLLRIVDVESAIAFQATDDGLTVRTSVELAREPRAARLRLEGLLHRNVRTLDVYELGFRLREARFLETRWAMDTLPAADIYMAALELDFGDGRWRQLTNERRDSFRWAVHHRFHRGVGMDHGPPAPGLPERLTAVLNECAAEPCWPSIEQSVLREWRSCMLRLGASNPPAWRELLTAATMRWPVDASPSWVPIHHPLEEVPWLFSAPSGLFGELERDDAQDGVSHLTWLARTAGEDRVREAVEAAGVKEHVLWGFSNVREAERDPSISLHSFDFSRYVGAISQIPSEDRESLWTARQKRLTTSHHDWCCERFAERLNWVHVPGRNQVRMGFVRDLILAAGPVARDLTGSSTIHLAGPAHLHTSWSHDVGSIARDVPHVLSLWARSSRFGEIENLVTALRGRTNLSRGEILRTVGLLVRLAPELFGFYLLLWELAAIGERARG